MKHHHFKIFLILLWLALTLSMAGWWMLFTFKLIEESSAATDVLRLKNMIFWEGLVWMVLLLVGGVTLSFYVVREQRHVKQFRFFVASLSHDLKTSLASLRLQAESLKEDLGEASSPLIPRLVADTVRLQLQLENSLFLAHASTQKLYYETLNLSDVLKKLEPSWPHVKIHLSEDTDIYGDDRAINSILRNIIHNAVIHGQADEIFIEVAGGGKLSIRDNGKGFSGDLSQLGEIFYRHNPSHGSGVGLYIVSQLMNDMNGEVSFPKSVQGFQVDLKFRGQV